ncbi:hypothetical protein IA57_05415 [Mangrovimonas yunxiaonensis]|uniref:Outer membrane protein beta-barrel domain-containing protein n=1 Tax=Mangrovimonas yunxiaonensis TaxID=1197477 RepID=A0A084TKN5_9FLAO|nr:hypothetical protein [Mangrovimonas yunxiaonensis]KFB01271.1 hypothetical protein IA57_05415 [Mangrovimonas yunxiaonensis]GGH37689.1 hypothetical protein GCM10011364_05860 [Mangrovimonas yunxiaonensis]
MKQNKHFILLVVFCIGFVTTFYAQHKRYAIKNGFGLYGGLTQYDILTDNFETQPGNGWMVGASATVDIPHKWYNISYTIQLAENKVGIASRQATLPMQSQFLDYKVFSAQIALLMHIKLVKSFVTIDVGPMLQYNGELELEDDQYENFVVANYDNLLAKDISGISKFNVDGAVGLSAGFSHFRLKAQYIYGFTNMLAKLDKADDLDVTGNDKKIKGNQSMLAFTAMITF